MFLNFYRSYTNIRVVFCYKSDFKQSVPLYDNNDDVTCSVSVNDCESHKALKQSPSFAFNQRHMGAICHDYVCMPT